MLSTRVIGSGIAAVVLALIALPASAQSFKVQCPSSTTLHPSETSAAYTGPHTITKTITRKDGSTFTKDYVDNGGGIKCQEISGGDGFATMGDGTQTYLFGFGPLSGLTQMAHGLEGTVKPSVFNTDNATVLDSLSIGAPVNQTDGTLTVNGTADPYTFNGAVGYARDPAVAGYPLNGHVDPRLVMDVGVMNANMPAPLMAIDEDDEFFLTLTNVGQVMRPDLFEQHTVHFHGYPNASAFYDGVPDASVAINIGGSFTYYYLAPDAGTYFWHCHISPPEHLQMGMVGQLFVRPRQNRVAVGGSLYTALQNQQGDPRTACTTEGILCSTPVPAADNGATRAATGMYAYNDGDGSTHYDVEYPIQIHGFDPNFHFVGMTFNPESFTDLKDKYFLLNGRSYPDTVQPGTMTTQSTDGTLHASQPLPTIINIPAGGKALLRIADLDVTEYQTLASLGIRMHVIGLNARLLRDMAGNNMAYDTNSITLAGGESIDVLLDASSFAAPGTGPKQKFYLYTPNLDHLSNDAENFGGLMTEINICNAVDPTTKECT